MKILNDKINTLNQEQREALGNLMRDNAEEFKNEVLKNRDKPLDLVVGELAAKYGLTKVD